MNFFIAAAFALATEIIGAVITSFGANERADEVIKAAEEETRLRNQLNTLRDAESARVLNVKTRAALHTRINLDATRGIDTESGYTRAGNQAYVSQLKGALKYLGDTGALKGKIAESQLELAKAQAATPGVFETVGTTVAGLGTTLSGSVAGAKIADPKFSLSKEWKDLVT
jgi:hypothetical protein